MPRTRSYDPDEVLDQAVEVFWARGFENTSIDDLVKATGVQRYGLYESFGDKRGLFLKALHRYGEQWITDILGDLEQEGASLPQLCDFFERLRVIVPQEVAPPGCLMCNSAAELGGHDREVDKIVRRYMDRLQAVFEKALGRALDLGQVHGGVRPPVYARYLVGVVLGVSLQKRTRAGQAALDDFVTTALSLLTL